MSDLFKKLVAEVIRVEGGFVDHPDDSGGATCWGITQRLARAYGYRGHMKDLTQAEAARIYKLEFWDKLKLDELAEVMPRVAEELFDSSVNVGQTAAAGWLQRSLNALNKKGELWPDLSVDGDVGVKTLESVKALKSHRASQGELVLLWMLTSLQGAFYVSLAERREKDESFVYGWFVNRVILKC